MDVKTRPLAMTCVAFGIPLCHGLVLSFSFPGAMSGLLLMALILAMLGYGIAGVIFVGIGIARAWKRQWDALLPCLFIPAVIAMFLLVPGAYGSIFAIADYVHFATFSARYTQAVDAVPRTGGPRYLLFLWKVVPGSVFGPDTEVCLVFDESNEFARLDYERTDAWKIRAERTFKIETNSHEAPSMPDNAHHLFGHWYVFRVDY